MAADNESVTSLERRFGRTMAGALFMFGAYEALRKQTTVGLICMVSGALIGFITLIAPRTLAPLAKNWLLLGRTIGMVTSPLVLGVIFFLIITPISVIARLFGRDQLRLARPTVTSYWVARSVGTISADSFSNQF